MAKFEYRILGSVFGPPEYQHTKVHQVQKIDAASFGYGAGPSAPRPSGTKLNEAPPNPVNVWR